MCVACLTSLDCPTGDMCMHDQCAPPKPCTSDKQCAALDAVCSGEAGVCVQCQTADECPAGNACVANQCHPPGAPCKSSKECGPYEQLCDKSAGVCVACVEHADCPAKGYCSGNVCVPDVCKPGQKACASPTTLAVCGNDGEGATDIVCAAGHACEDDDCRPVVCTPGQLLCTADGKPASCSKRGTVIMPGAPCPADTKCLAGVCTSAKCVAGSTQCVGTAIGTCAADGLQITETACPVGTACDPASQPVGCKPQVCKPGSATCQGPLAKTCTANGLGLTTTTIAASSAPTASRGRASMARVSSRTAFLDH
ncbi:MAG: hypothetical protein FJ100_05210 [Deltaproteobacteria bacterium]|nr:hypothetical protein [Deltaproteobacteria bacterium]